MRIKGKFPGVQKALDFINRNLEASAWKSIEYLPSIKNLAKQADVSLVTMHKAMQHLKEKGVIHGSRFHRMRIDPINLSNLKKDSDAGMRTRIRERIEKDLLAGTFGLNGRLPQFKELQSRYGVCFRTMRSILNDLAHIGVISPLGKSFEIPRIAHRATPRRIVFITSKGYFDQVSALNSEHNRIVNLFENECTRLGLMLDIVEIDFYDPGQSRKTAMLLPDIKGVIGFIFDVWWYESTAFRQSSLDMLERIASFKKPVAILDEIGNFLLPIRLASNPLIQTYSIEGKQAGRRVARFLLSLSHQSIAYISSVHHSAWSKERFEGIAEQYSLAGHADTVHLVSESALKGDLTYLLTASGLSDKEIKKLIASSRTPSQAASLEKEWLHFKETVPPPYIGHIPLDSKVQNSFSTISHLLNHETDPAFLGAMCNAALHEIGQRIFQLDVEGLFNEALSFKNVTAWVCATDGTAFNALEYLKKRTVKVPEELSVIGFDNTPVEAIEKRLTTVDFNAAGFISHMLNFILRPPRPRGQYRHQAIEVESIIMQRTTAGKPGRGYAQRVN